MADLRKEIVDIGKAFHLELKMLCKKDLDSLCKGAEAASQEWHVYLLDCLKSLSVQRMSHRMFAVVHCLFANVFLEM